MIYFRKCNIEWNKQTDDIARTIMLGDAFDSEESSENKNKKESLFIILMIYLII